MEKAKKKKQRYTIIPEEVNYDSTLSDGAKVLFGEIAVLTKKEGFCWATNRHFANLYKKSQITISRLVSELVKAKHVKTEQTKGIGRRIYVLTKMNIPIIKNDKTSNQNRLETNSNIDNTTLIENDKQNNTSSNNINNKINIYIENLLKEEKLISVIKRKYITLNTEQVNRLMKLFADEQDGLGRQYKTYNDFKIHFNNWLPKNSEKIPQNKSTYGIYRAPNKVVSTAKNLT